MLDLFPEYLKRVQRQWPQSDHVSYASLVHAVTALRLFASDLCQHQENLKETVRHQERCIAELESDIQHLQGELQALHRWQTANSSQLR